MKKIVLISLLLTGCAVEPVYHHGGYYPRVSPVVPPVVVTPYPYARPYYGGGHHGHHEGHHRD